jgi:pimeloyl-ACP methyl ester carboxylesterase
MPISTTTCRTRHADVSVLDTGGTGYPVLLLHGSGSSKDVFEHQFSSALGVNSRLIAIDLPGHGKSSDANNPAAAYAIRGFAETVSDVLESLGLKQVAVLGWSLGGHIGIELLSSNPAVTGLMVVGAPPLSPGPLGMLRAFQTNWDLLLASKEVFSEHDAQRFHQLCFDGRGTASQLASIRRADGRVRSTVVRSMMNGQGCDQRRVVEKATVPIAVVNGASDPFTRLSYVASLDYGNLWTGRCHVLADAGHAVFWDQPVHFNALLGRFVDEVAALAVAEKRSARKIA